MNIIEIFTQPIFSALASLVTVTSVIGWLLRDILMPIIRLGQGLSGLPRKSIAIFSAERFELLKSLLVDSGIFKAENIEKIEPSNLEKAKRHSILLVDWKNFGEQLDDILRLQADGDQVLIVYAPTGEGRIADENMNKIGLQRNTIVVNFIGRLLNDILISLMLKKMGTRTKFIGLLKGNDF